MKKPRLSKTGSATTFLVGLFYFLTPFLVLANTYSLDLEKDSSQYAYRTSDLSIIGSDNVTFGFWYKLESTPVSNTLYGLFSLGDATSNVQYELNYWNDAGTTKLQIKRRRGNVESNNATYDITLATNVWWHFVVRYDGTNIKLYTAQAGETHTERATVASSGDGTGAYFAENFTLGANNEASSITSYTDGLLDDFRVYDASVAIATIDADFETDLVGNETNLVAYYKFENNVNDTTANAYHLTGSGSPSYSTDIPYGSTGGGSATSSPVDWFATSTEYMGVFNDLTFYSIIVFFLSMFSVIAFYMLLFK